MYLHLARASLMRGRPMVRDKLLVLAGIQAHEMGLEPIAALCRLRILSHNPRHLVRRWPTLGEAFDDARFQTYFKQLKRRYSHERIEHMLDSLGIELGRERDAYYSDLEYAASLLDTRPEAIEGLLARGPQPPAPVSTSAASTASSRATWTRSARRALDFPILWAGLLALLVGLTILAALWRR